MVSASALIDVAGNLTVGGNTIINGNLNLAGVLSNSASQTAWFTSSRPGKHLSLFSFFNFFSFFFSLLFSFLFLFSSPFSLLFFYLLFSYDHVHSKYPLFFNQLINCTAPGSKDHTALTEANNQMQKVATHVNDFHREAENMNRVYEIQRRVHGKVINSFLLVCYYLF